MFRWIALFALLGVFRDGGSGLAHADHPGKSPGPPGGFLDRDYRTNVTWIETDGPNKTNDAAEAARARGPGDYARRLRFGGRDRYFEVHAPPSYRPGTPAPVVFVLHGGGGFASAVRFQSGMDTVADREGFLVVYPAGTGRWYDDRLLHWNAGAVFKNKRQRSVDDVGYLIAVLNDLTALFTVDRNRIYATGISNGGHMCYRLAAEASDHFAAIGPIAGQRSAGQLVGPPPRPVPVIHFHGVQDTWAPYGGGTSGSYSAFKPYQFPPVEEAIATWVKHNGCDPKPVTTTTGDAACDIYRPRKGGAEVVFWKLDGAGHTWPGGRRTLSEKRGGVGEVSQDINASQTIWEFFERHKLPADSQSPTKKRVAY